MITLIWPGERIMFGLATSQGRRTRRLQSSAIALLRRPASFVRRAGCRPGAFPMPKLTFPSPQTCPRRSLGISKKSETNGRKLGLHKSFSCDPGTELTLIIIFFSLTFSRPNAYQLATTLRSRSSSWSRATTSASSSRRSS